MPTVGDPDEPWVVQTLAVVARAFGVATDTIKSWRRNGMPGNPGSWDLLAVQAWRTRRNLEIRPAKIQESAVEKADQDEEFDQFSDIEEVKRRVLLIKEKNDALKYEQALGRLVDREEVDIEKGTRVAELNTSLVGMADKLAARISPAMRPHEARSMIMEEIRQYLEFYNRPYPDDLAGDLVVDSELEEFEDEPKKRKRKKSASKKGKSKKKAKHVQAK